MQVLQIMSGSDIEHPAWLSHSGGSEAMFQAFGPHRLKTRFEKSLLYLHAPQFVSQLALTSSQA
jgi:hypothetical protein